jgi:hypothetical protein
MTDPIRTILGLGDLTRDQIVAMGPQFARHVTDFETTIGVQLARDGSDWSTAYYDRGGYLIAWGLILGRNDLIDAGRKIVANYRDLYLPSGPSAHWVMPDGVAADALMGDANSRAVFADRRVTGSSVGQFNAFSGDLTYIDAMANYSAGHGVENRIIARVLHVQALIATLFPQTFTPDDQAYFKTSPNGIDGTNSLTLHRSTLALAHKQQKPDGSWPKENQIGADCNFMDALEATVEGISYDLFERRADIVDSVTRTCRFLMTQWNETGANGPGFKYFSAPVTTAEGFQSDNTTPDLTLLHLAPFYFAARFPGNGDLLTFADHAFDIGVQNTWLSPSKQYNQAYHSTYRALAWRAQAIATSPSIPPTMTTISDRLGTAVDKLLVTIAALTKSRDDAVTAHDKAVADLAALQAQLDAVTAIVVKLETV